MWFVYPYINKLKDYFSGLLSKKERGTGGGGKTWIFHSWNQIILLAVQQYPYDLLSYFWDVLKKMCSLNLVLFYSDLPIDSKRIFSRWVLVSSIFLLQIESKKWSFWEVLPQCIFSEHYDIRESNLMGSRTLYLRLKT